MHTFTSDRSNALLKVLILIGLIYLFLLSITLLGDSVKAMGKGVATAIMQTVSNPFLGLFVGIFSTSLVQSSSMTTSLVVGLVAGGIFGTDPLQAVHIAIPIIMGANIGTSVTNTVVSFGHISRDAEFERAFAASIVHDFFNILAVLVLFPLQYFFNIIGIAATFASDLFVNIGGLELIDPLGAILDPVSKGVLKLFPTLPWIGLIVAFMLLFISLKYIVTTMRSLVLRKIEAFLNQYLFRNMGLALLVGLVFTAIVQSSSITTSLVIPLAAAGILSLNKLFPYMLGANIGTTVTTLLASLATKNSVCITIAISHLFFNVIGIAIFLPLRQIPISMAYFFAQWTRRWRFFPIIYVGTFFFLIPILLILIMR